MAGRVKLLRFLLGTERGTVDAHQIFSTPQLPPQIVSILCSLHPDRAGAQQPTRQITFQLEQGKRKMIDGFVRWCQRGDVGLSQAITVESVEEEDPTGLLDDFYVMTGR